MILTKRKEGFEVDMHKSSYREKCHLTKLHWTIEAKEGKPDICDDLDIEYIDDNYRGTMAASQSKGVCNPWRT